MRNHELVILFDITDLLPAFTTATELLAERFNDPQYLTYQNQIAACWLAERFSRDLGMAARGDDFLLTLYNRDAEYHNSLISHKVDYLIGSQVQQVITLYNLPSDWPVHVRIFSRTLALKFAREQPEPPQVF